MKDNELKTIETYIPLKYHIYFENDIEKDTVLYDNVCNYCYETSYLFVEKLDNKYIVVKDYISGNVQYLIKDIGDLSVKCRITTYNEVKRKCRFIEQEEIKFNNKD
jgi:hypothetical protein